MDVARKFDISNNGKALVFNSLVGVVANLAFFVFGCVVSAMDFDPELCQENDLRQPLIGLAVMFLVSAIASAVSLVIGFMILSGRKTPLSFFVQGAGFLLSLVVVACAIVASVDLWTHNQVVCRQQDLWEYMQIYMIAVWAGASGMCCVTCCLSLCLFGTSDDVVADPHAMDSSL